MIYLESLIKFYIIRNTTIFMKGAVSILQAILIFAIAITLATIAMPWAYNAINRSLEMSEMGTIRKEMALCNDKLIETARTGTANKCIFSAKRGKMSADWDGIYYDLLSTYPICDRHSWDEIDKERHLESMCDVTLDIKHYYLRWRWPSEVNMEGSGFGGDIKKAEEHITDIEFDPSVRFTTITVVIEFEAQEGQAGNNIEITRTSLLEDKAVLKVILR